MRIANGRDASASQMARIGIYLIVGVAMQMSATGRCAAQEITGHIALPGHWTVFPGFERDDPVPPRETLASIPDRLTVDGRTAEPVVFEPVNSQCDFSHLPGMGRMKVAYVFVPIEAPAEGVATLGMGADWRVQVWLNGEEIFDNTGEDETQPPYPPSINDFRVGARFEQGRNVLAARLVSGSASSVLALGGPDALRAGNFQSILNDPFLMVQALPESRWSGAERWTQPHLRAEPGDKPAADIGTRLELFVDDFLVDAMTGGAERRLHHPVPREVVHVLDKPWEGNTSAYLSVVQDGDRIRIYYNASPRRQRQSPAVIESQDGVNFSRPNLGIVDFEGSTDNNLLPRFGPAGHHFTPFIDTNPAAPPEERYKALARHPVSGQGFGGFVSSDGIDWEVVEKGLFSSSPSDSQNVAFWDPVREKYVAYAREFDDSAGRRVRTIRRAESRDFVNWTETGQIAYTDDRVEQMYTNGIRPYFRAPHIYIGLPNRFVTGRKKVAEHPNAGINDVVLMSSRDGKVFDRWEEGFIRPGPEPEMWTDRNTYPSWGMAQTSPEEISVYWTEHYRYPGMRFRRGTIRTDGFVSLQAGSEVGEMLTRPLVFSGDRLIVNYATSAIGTIRFEICDMDGEPIEGFALADSELLYGNEIEHMVAWHGRTDLSELAGQPVRLRVRLHDADLYSIRFASSEAILERIEGLAAQIGTQ